MSDTFTFEEAAGDTATATKGDTFDFEEATGTPSSKAGTFSFEEAQQARPLPSGVKPSEAGAGRGTLGGQPLPEAVKPAKPTTRDAGSAFGAERAQATRARAQDVTDEALNDPERSVLDTPEFTQQDIRPTGRMTDAEYQRDYTSNVKPAPEAPSYPTSRDTIRNTPAHVVVGENIRKALGSSVAAAAAEGTISGAASIAKVAPGLMAGAADLANKAGIPGSESVRDFMLDNARIADQFGEAVQGKGGDYYTKLVGNVFNSVTQNIPVIMMGMGGATEIVAGRAVADTAAKQAMSNAMRTLFVQTAGQEYADSRNLGFDPGESAARAGIYGAAEVIGERFGFHEQMAAIRAAIGGRKLASHELGRVLATEMLKEIPGEELTTAIEFLADKYGPAAKTPKATLAEYFEQAADTATTTIGQTLLMGAPASLRGTYQRANAAAAYDSARLAGMVINPPFLTDTPDVQRTKTIGIFEAIAAKYGIDPDAVKRATEVAKTMPSDQVGPFLSRLTDAYQKRGLVTQPVDETAADTLEAGPIDDPKVVDKMAKTAEKEQEQAKKAKKEGKTTESQAPVSGTNTPVSRGTAAAEEDLSGLSEPARPSVIDKIATEGATHPSNDLTEPTQPQKEAENYKVGHDNTTIPGERLSIENGAGSTRKGVSPEGKPWSTEMKDHYGRILGTVGMDSTPEKPQHVDFFAKAGTPEGHTGPVFVVDQVDPKTGKADEHKVLFGYDSVDQAKKAYLAHYEKGWKGLGAITETSLDDFKTWVHSDATSKPFAPAAAEQRVSAAKQALPAAHVIARVGPAPSHAQPLELRPNEDGSSSVWHDGHEVLDFESAKPVKIPAGTSDADALQIIKDSGAFGRRAKYFAPKGDTEVAPVEKPAKPKPSTPGTAVSDEYLARKRAEQAAEAPTAQPEKINKAPEQAALPEVAAAPPAPPKPRKLSDKQAFASDYAHFAGRDLQQSVQLSDTGETAELRIPASRAMRALDARLQALTDLKACIGRHA